VRQLLIDPLCVAALNTPAQAASGRVFLRVLRDALFSGPGSADLLLPRCSLDALLPEPAARWLQARGAELCLSQRVGALQRQGTQWVVDSRAFDAVVLACSATEAARLVEPTAPSWSALARAMPYEPIVTVYLRCDGGRLPSPMTALLEGPHAPAQYAFDHGALGATPGVFAFVVSGAQAWVDQGLEATGQAVLQQAAQQLGPALGFSSPTVLRVMAEKRATFRCTPALQRPTARIAPGLVAAGDHVQGPYPATLEGAVRSGDAALVALRFVG
jgi:hydroxysqualene dehydroxylase